MGRILKRIALVILGLLVLAIAGLVYLGWPDEARLDLKAVTGPQPRITKPREQQIPTIQIATAVGWPAGAAPTPAPGLAVARFADGLDHPRWLYRLPNGDVLVAESNSPPLKGGGFAGWLQKRLLGRSGALVPSPDRITLLRDADGDGVAELRTPFLTRLRSPYGMVLVGGWLYVANTDALVRFPYEGGQTRITARPETVITYPGEGHWARNVVASPDGARLYVAVGSATDHGEGGVALDRGRALILEVDPAAKTSTVFGAGLRNPNGLAFEPATGALWTVVNERDMLGSDMTPDYLTSVKAGDHFGWPWYYWGGHADTRVKPENPPLRAKVRTPDYALGPHVAPLGLTFAQGARLGPAFGQGAFIGLHGSWNRKPPAGYKVVYLPFGADGRPAPGAEMVDILTGFLSARGEAQGRPVGVIVDKTGGLLVADDVGNVVWRVSAAASPAPARAKAVQP